MAELEIDDACCGLVRCRWTDVVDFGNDGCEVTGNSESSTAAATTADNAQTSAAVIARLSTRIVVGSNRFLDR